MVKYTVHITDGLGNRLFQIASVYGLAKRDGAEFIISSSNQSQHSSQNYDFLLQSFEKADPRMPWSHCILPNGQAHRFINIPKMGNDTRFFGFFQSEKYFAHVTNDIRKYFELPREISEKVQSTYPNINNGFFIHVRRGDYLNAGNVRLYNTQLEGYYQQVFERIQKELPKDISIFVLSNDITWCRQSPLFQNINNCTFVEADELFCLSLMIQCRYGGASANSSFSWWGLWLNSSPDKKMYTPDPWFLLPSHQTNDMIFEGLIQLPTVINSA